MMDISNDPDLSHKAALAVQEMTRELRIAFVSALLKAKSVDDLHAEYRTYLERGYKAKPLD